MPAGRCGVSVMCVSYCQNFRLTLAVDEVYEVRPEEIMKLIEKNVKACLEGKDTKEDSETETGESTCD